MKIGIYALAKNESKHAAAWAASCEEADVRVVTDTGSTDGTQAILEASGVTVATGAVIPWRWDDAHNLSLSHLPPDLDVAIRLDLDERLQPGWRQAVEAAWQEGINCLHYRYVWGFRADGTPGQIFNGDRVHCRAGFRWAQATHEGLLCWTGEKVAAFAPGLEIHHHREAGKTHSSDLHLLRVAVAEAPLDARARWYLARQLDYQGNPEAISQFTRYLSMRGGWYSERAYARRQLWHLTGDPVHLEAITREAPDEPDGHELLALRAYHLQAWEECLEHALRGIASTGQQTHATNPDSLAKCHDLASVALWNLQRQPEALSHAREAMARLPEDKRIAANVAAMERVVAGEAVPV